MLLLHHEESQKDDDEEVSLAKREGISACCYFQPLDIANHKTWVVVFWTNALSVFATVLFSLQSIHMHILLSCSVILVEFACSMHVLEVQYTHLNTKQIRHGQMRQYPQSQMRQYPH